MGVIWRVIWKTLERCRWLLGFFRAGASELRSLVACRPVSLSACHGSKLQGGSPCMHLLLPTPSDQPWEEMETSRNKIQCQKDLKDLRMFVFPEVFVCSQALQGCGFGNIAPTLQTSIGKLAGQVRLVWGSLSQHGKNWRRCSRSQKTDKTWQDYTDYTCLCFGTSWSWKVTSRRVRSLRCPCGGGKGSPRAYVPWRNSVPARISAPISFLTNRRV